MLNLFPKRTTRTAIHDSRYLPDGNFTDLKLDFDITWQGIQAFESSPWTDWARLDATLGDGTPAKKPLSQLVTVAPAG